MAKSSFQPPKLKEKSLWWVLGCRGGIRRYLGCRGWDPGGGCREDIWGAGGVFGVQGATVNIWGGGGWDPGDIWGVGRKFGVQGVG